MDTSRKNDRCEGKGFEPEALFRAHRTPGSAFTRTWMKLFIDPHEVCQSPHDIFAEMSDKENELNRTKQLYFSPQQIHQPT